MNNIDFIFTSTKQDFFYFLLTFKHAGLYTNLHSPKQFGYFSCDAATSYQQKAQKKTYYGLKNQMSFRNSFAPKTKEQHYKIGFN